jgi:hypothetical protein
MDQTERRRATANAVAKIARRGRRFVGPRISTAVAVRRMVVLA